MKITKREVLPIIITSLINNGDHLLIEVDRPSLIKSGKLSGDLKWVITDHYSPNKSFEVIRTENFITGKDKDLKVGDVFCTTESDYSFEFDIHPLDLLAEYIGLEEVDTGILSKNLYKEKCSGNLFTAHKYGFKELKRK